MNGQPMTFDFLFIRVPDELSALGLIWVGTICLMWGWELMSYALDLPCGFPPDNGLVQRLYFAPWLVRWIHRLSCIFDTFHFWLGSFFTLALCPLFIAIGVTLLSRPLGVELWGMGIIIAAIITSTIAFSRWVRGKE